MPTNLKKDYITLGETKVRCTNRETSADKGSTPRTFDIILDFTGVSDSQLIEWASATAVIRVQNKLRSLGDEKLKEFEKAGVFEVNVLAGMTEEKAEAVFKNMSEERKLSVLFDDCLSRKDFEMARFIVSRMSPEAKAEALIRLEGN